MADIKLYIATSIDGFIARKDGSLDWLNNHPNPDQLDYGYAEFLAEIDTIIMGRKTYEEVLGFGFEWPYDNCRTYVLTSDKNFKVRTENTTLIHGVDHKTIGDLRSGSKKHIWMVGGGKVIASFLDHNAIDEMMIFIIPLILGSGIRMLPEPTRETNFELVRSDSFNNGVVSLIYKLKRND